MFAQVTGENAHYKVRLNIFFLYLFQKHVSFSVYCYFVEYNNETFSVI